MPQWQLLANMLSGWDVDPCLRVLTSVINLNKAGNTVDIWGQIILGGCLVQCGLSTNIPPLDASNTPTNCDDQKYPRTLPSVPWGEDLPSGAQRWKGSGSVPLYLVDSGGSGVRGDRNRNGSCSPQVPSLVIKAGLQQASKCKLLTVISKFHKGKKMWSFSAWICREGLSGQDLNLKK